MKALPVQRFIYSQMARRPRVSNALDCVGARINRLPITYDTGLARARATVLVSVDPVEVEAAIAKIQISNPFEAETVLAEQSLITANPKASLLQFRTERYVLGIIDNWQKLGRFDESEVFELKSDLKKGRIQEYLRGLGSHLAIKALTELVSFTAIGIIISGNLGLGLVLISSQAITRSAYTLVRMYQTRGSDIPYWRALILGANPFFGGIFAYPLQMTGSSPKISSLIISDIVIKGGLKFCSLLRIKNPKTLAQIEAFLLKFAMKLNTPVAELLAGIKKQ